MNGKVVRLTAGGLAGIGDLDHKAPCPHAKVPGRGCRRHCRRARCAVPSRDCTGQRPEPVERGGVFGDGFVEAHRASQIRVCAEKGIEFAFGRSGLFKGASEQSGFQWRPALSFGLNLGIDRL